MTTRPSSKSRLLRFLGGVAVIVLAIARGTAQDYLVHDWDLDEGLPSTCMNAVIRTPDGYIWLGTQHGLVRFDGIRFVTFNHENTPAITDNRISSMTLDTKGGFWAGAVDGTLVKQSGGNFTAVNVTNVTQGKRINSMTMDATGNLWLGTAWAGLVRFKDGHCRVLSTTNGLVSPDVWQVQTDTQGRLWYLTSPGRLGWVDGDQCRQLRGAPGLTNSIRAIAPARDGGLWLATLGSQNAGTRVFKLRDSQATEEAQPYPWLQSSERARPGTLLEDEAGNLWCGTAGEGVFLQSPNGPWRAITDDLPMSQAEVLCLMQDEGDSVWIGTRTSGLHHSVPRPLSVIHLPPAHKQNILLTVCVRRDGSVWGGTDSAGVFRWQDSEVARFGEQAGIPGVRVHALFEDSSTNLWAGTAAGLFRYDDGRFQAISNAALHGNITALYEDRQANLWAGTARGVVRVGSNQVLGERKGLPAGQVAALTQDNAGKFWIVVAGRGLFHEEDDGFRLWKSGNSAPPPWRWADGRYGRVLVPDADGSLWVGTYGYGLFRVNGDRIRGWFWQVDGLPSNHILSLQEDTAGNLWGSCENGIFSYAKKALLDYRGEGSPRPIPFRLTKAEGLPYKVCSGSGQPTGAKSPDGRFWFPDGPALVSLDPLTTPRNQQTWPPIIEEVRVDGVPLLANSGDPVQVKSGAQSFEFVFTSPNILAPNRLRFRHRLEGLDEDWAVEGNQRSVKYSGLPPGGYTFRVMTRESDEVWSGREAALRLTVVPRWWERKTIRFAATLALLGGIVLTVWQAERTRSRRKLAAVERERALEHERARIARDIHDDLGASLTQVALLGDMAGDTAGSPDELRAQTRQISEAAHEMAQSLEAIVWAVRPENDTLRSLLEYMNRRTDELFEKMPRQYQFTIPIQLPEFSVHAEVRHNVFLAYKEALTNALKHAQATEVRIEVTCDRTTCRITVADNGKGFETGGVRAGGTGLKNMRLRLEEIRGRAELQTQPGQGTTVRLEFPLNRDAAK